MVARTLWLWLCVGWLMTWLSEAIINPSTASVCDLGVCRCIRGQLLCDCSTTAVKDVTLKEEMLDSLSFSSISITNCSHVHVTAQAFSGLPALQQVSISNIATLTLEEKAFSWTTDNPQHSGLVINISNCAIPEIPSYCFRGSLRDILLSSVNISRVQAFAFASIDHAEKIEFNRVFFANLEPQSFKKFSVDFLSVNDSRFNTLPTRTMIDVDVHQEVKFENVKVDTIKYSGLKIHGPKHFRMTNCLIGHTEHQAFHVHTRGPVSIIDNVFPHIEMGAFVGFTVEKRFLQEFGKQELIFENNTMADFENAPLILNTTGFSPRLDKIMINQKCSCPSTEYWTSDLVFFSSNPRVVTAAPHVSTVMYCLNAKTISNVKDYQRLFCNVKDSSILLTLALISGSIVSISVLILFVYCGFKERAKRYMNVPNSPSPLKQNKNHILVIPDGKTYRETELHVIVEHAEPIVPTEYVRTPSSDFKS